MMGLFSTVPVPGCTWLYLALPRSAIIYLTIDCHWLTVVLIIMVSCWQKLWREGWEAEEKVVGDKKQTHSSCVFDLWIWWWHIKVDGPRDWWDFGRVPSEEFRWEMWSTSVGARRGFRGLVPHLIWWWLPCWWFKIMFLMMRICYHHMEEGSPWCEIGWGSTFVAWQSQADLS